MNYVLMLKGDLFQIVLEPESDCDKKLCELVANLSFTLEPTIHQTPPIHETRGGYLRQFSEEDCTLTIVLRPREQNKDKP